MLIIYNILYLISNQCNLRLFTVAFEKLHYCETQADKHSVDDANFQINVRDTVSVVSSFNVSLQPLNPRQAMVKRLSVVNLENFRRQYARRRWKVKCSTVWIISLKQVRAL